MTVHYEPVHKSSNISALGYRCLGALTCPDAPAKLGAIFSSEYRCNVAANQHNHDVKARGEFPRPVFFAFCTAERG